MFQHLKLPNFLKLGLCFVVWVISMLVYWLHAVFKAFEWPVSVLLWELPREFLQGSVLGLKVLQRPSLLTERSESGKSPYTPAPLAGCQGNQIILGCSKFSLKHTVKYAKLVYHKCIQKIILRLPNTGQFPLCLITTVYNLTLFYHKHCEKCSSSHTRILHKWRASKSWQLYFQNKSNMTISPLLLLPRTKSKPTSCLA